MTELLREAPLFLLVIVFICALFVLSKAADQLTDQAVFLAKIFRIPDMIVGATIVSLGTSLPEFATSVTAVSQGSGGMALGNALGSIITNTSLILGIGTLYGAIPTTKKSMKNSLFLLGCLLMLYLPLVFKQSQQLPLTLSRWNGWLLLIALPLFLMQAFRKQKKTEMTEQTNRQQLSFSIMIKPIIYLFLSALLVAISSTCLVASVQITAARIGISEAIISATIVALGTSLPELSTTIMAAKKGYGALAFGNIIGASLMNLLLVLSSTLILSKEAVIVPRAFLLFHFPIVFLILVCLLYNLIVSKSSQFTKNAGMGLLLIYLCYLIGNIWIG
ncbi:hypothetical protein A5886_001471 [Enterococcus sp. 8G7_MSG3316]|uniref:Sodium/calcium exchanger membrane region domain-containing protein n=1 Tax=Candidatus Enterococcus testudinis TaxID=1834191 RepID=A0A242A5U4_9ENTE|nr:sodium:calcium antiporter [Enterococcus sp. 8G7_MSG3316]OTN76394.1 hypothetical protein A5886_001471 [Enterococcus sp. 8G7_MSG3316]